MFTIPQRHDILTALDEACCIVLDIFSLPYLLREKKGIPVIQLWAHIVKYWSGEFLSQTLAAPDLITSPCMTLLNMFVCE